jgi:hypothetical protein
MARAKKNLKEVLNRLAAAEERFLASEFLAPVLPGGQVNVRIAGIICTLQIQPADFAGWGIFRPKSHAEAALVRAAKLTERQRYLELFPAVRLIVASKQDDAWLAIPAHRSDGRFQIDGLIPVQLMEDAQLFEVIEARFDGIHFWYASAEARSDPAAASYLRQALDKLIVPEQIQRRGLTAEERSAYALNYWPRYLTSEEGKRSQEEKRLRDALAHAGANLRSYIDRRDVYTVTYEVDGERHVSAISKKDLSVQVAGICLSGEDAKFDLQSLVGVIREGRGEGELVRVRH